MEPVNIWEYEKLARERLPTMAYDYFAGGAHDELTIRENHAAYDRIRLFPHVLRDVSTRDISTTILGERIALPVLIAPTAFQGMACTEAEIATTGAAGAAGTIMALSTLSNCALEEVAAMATGPLWFQLYVYRDRAATVELIRRVEAAGFTALMLTVDAPVLGRRERDVRNRFQLPAGLTARNLAGAGMGKLPSDASGSALAAYFATLLDASLSWQDLDWLRSITRLPILLKGVIRADDAVRALEHGVAGIVVSNHGGRQLDTAPATIEALPAIADAVAGRAEILVDGGVRRGTDVVKALALGARATMVGRPILWGLAVAGEQGATRVLQLLRDEIDVALGLTGCASVGEITRDLVD